MKSVTVTNLSKIYQINPEKEGFVQQESLKDDLMKLLKKPSKIFETKILNKIKLSKVKSSKLDFWALKNISFSLEEGEVLGVIGENGSGKSTLLKILSGVTFPTFGEITLKGKTASLLAVGLGFHNDLTGRENIFLNGALLGFRKRDLEREFDEIIDFSGIGKFIDTPVKYYSSGMYVRLAFSIATSKCMRPDIFFIDEVLSVGDIAFQNKCLTRIKKLVKNSKTTVVIVSHDMEIIEKLCNRCVLMNKGKIKDIGSTQVIIEKYLKSLK